MKGKESSSSSRERDLVPLLPALPRPVLGGTASAEVRESWEKALSVWGRTVDALVGLKQLHRGTLREEEFAKVKQQLHRGTATGSGVLKHQLFPIE